jgi:hypothetical protein
MDWNMRASTNSTKKKLPVLGLILILLTNLVVGVMIVRDYGESRDERARMTQAERSIAAYTSDSRAIGPPFYIMSARIGSEWLQEAWKSLRPIEAWHFMHFLSFLMGVFFFFHICSRYMSQGAALGSTLLFNTQPLLWGHAWINPKDIPFMAFFLGSMALGLDMADSFESANPATANGRPSQGGTLQGLSGLVVLDWQETRPKKRLLLLGSAGFSLALLLVLVLTSGLVQGWIADLVAQAYSASPSSVLGQLFAGLAQNPASIPSGSYVQKGLALYRRLIAAFAVFVAFFCLACATLLLSRTRRQLWQATVQPFLRSMLSNATNRRVLLAGLFLGFSSSIRQLGPAAGLLVGLYFLARSGRKALPVLVAYFAIAMLVTYATWPRLWGEPVRGYLKAVDTALDYPWEGKVTFAGYDYNVDEVPRSYLPVLLSLQFTEPAIALFIAGIFIAGRKFIQREDWRLKLALIAAWFFGLLSAASILRPTMYDNFRQFLFLMPPLFVFAGIGLDWIMGRVRSAPVNALFLAAALLPGLYWDVRLHPYQYVYYNQLVGGVGGAFRRYETDYWVTSYREAAEYLNAHAPPGSQVVVWGADHIVKNYARDDLVISDYRKESRNPDPGQDFAVISTRHSKDLTLYSGAPVVFQVSRAGAIFVVVKRLSPQDSPQP